jgi:hypothetical protein
MDHASGTASAAHPASSGGWPPGGNGEGRRRGTPVPAALTTPVAANSCPVGARPRRRRGRSGTSLTRPRRATPIPGCSGSRSACSTSSTTAPTRRHEPWRQPGRSAWRRSAATRTACQMRPAPRRPWGTWPPSVVRRSRLPWTPWRHCRAADAGRAKLFTLCLLFLLRVRSMREDAGCRRRWHPRPRGASQRHRSSHTRLAYVYKADSTYRQYPCA